MALARSASVPGGLAINTGAANLFGSSTSQPPAGGGLFGSAGAAAQPAKPGGLFGSASPSLGQPAATQAPATSLFGGTAQPQQTGGGGGLFGQAAAAAKPAGSLFGASTITATTQLQKPAGGGLFGGGSTAAAAATTAPAGGSLFGSTATASNPAANQAQPAAGGGLFGTASTAAAQPVQATGGLFGSSTAAAPAASGGLFGRTQQQQQQQQQQQGQQQQQVIPGVRIDLSNLKGTTRFNDLQEGLQQEIMGFDSLIQAYVEQKNGVDAFLPAHGDSVAAIPADVRFVARKYDGVAGALAVDLQAIEALRSTVKQDAEHAQLSFQALDNQKLPAQFHTSGLWKKGRSGSGGGSGGGGGEEGEGDGDGAEASGSDLINYFSHTGDEIGAQLRRLEKNLGEIEVHMYGVQAGLLEQLQKVAASSRAAGGSGGETGGSGGSSGDDKVAELAAVLREFEESILTVASVVGSTREDMTSLQLGGFLGRR